MSVKQTHEKGHVFHLVLLFVSETPQSGNKLKTNKQEEEEELTTKKSY